MTVEQAILELKKCANDLIAVGDANSFIKSNKEEFIHRWIKVMQYYNYILNNINIDSEEFDEFIDIMNDITEKNPSLESWIYDIMKPTSEVKKSSVKEKEANINIEDVVNEVNALVDKINNMQSWDVDEVEIIKWKLEKNRELMVNNKSLFDQEIYENLMRNIEMALNKISKFNNMLDSDSMQGIMLM